MPLAKNVKNIVIHCSAGFAKVPGIENFWRNTLKWQGKGYHIIIDVDGTTYYLQNNSAVSGYTTDITKLNLNFITNGVLGFNNSTIHICYIGGVKNTGTSQKPMWVAEDTRTEAQKESLNKAIQHVILKLKEDGKDITKDLGVVGHRDFSRDQNNNGTIERWERIKECPSFDVLQEYNNLYSSKDRYNKLPTA